MARDPYAYSCFAKLTHQERRRLILQAENARSKGDMTAVMDTLIGGAGTLGSPYKTRR